MAAYVIADVEVTDPEKYEAYKDGVPALVEKHGGEYVVRGGEHVVLEGDWEPRRLVLMKFPDRASAEAFWDDQDYQPLKAARHASADSRLVLVEGILTRCHSFSTS